MSEVEPPHGLADATNSNGRTAANSPAGWHRNNPVLVLADVARLDTLCSAKDCRSARAFQVRFSGCRVRSQRGRT
jgi:hypothetical protein